jgi:DNA-binding CsgD family transcriptional regulator
MRTKYRPDLAARNSKARRRLNPSCGKIWQIGFQSDPTAAAAVHPFSANPGLERPFFEFAKDKLFPPEQTVVVLLLRRHSTVSVANNLKIAEGTGKIHRKHIYEKLSINSQVLALSGVQRSPSGRDARDFAARAATRYPPPGWHLPADAPTGRPDEVYLQGYWSHR